jgi:Spy/CpxP family protein refolding chaperone
MRRGESGWDHGGPGRREDMLLRGIELSSDQRQRIDSIRAQYRDQMHALWSDSSDPEQSREKMHDLMEQQTSDIRSVLTPDQQKVFDQNLEQIRAHMRDRDGRPDHPPPPAP